MRVGSKPYGSEPMTHFLTTSLKFSTSTPTPQDGRLTDGGTGRTRPRRRVHRPTSDKLLAIVNKFDGRTEAYWYSDWLAWDWSPKAAR